MDGNMLEKMGIEGLGLDWKGNVKHEMKATRV